MAMEVVNDGDDRVVMVMVTVVVMEMVMIGL